MSVKTDFSLIDDRIKDLVEEKPQTRRLFFALWPDDNTRTNIRKHLKKLIQHSDGKGVPDHNLHITLSFLGSIDESKQRCAEQFADTLRLSPFKLNIDKVDYWSKPKVLWAGCNQIPEQLNSFAYELNNGMRRCGIDVDKRPYVPHITLMRKVNKVSQDKEFKAFQWEVSNFVLVESISRSEGVHYQVIKTV